MDELEEFLKRAAEKRQARKGGPPRVAQVQRQSKPAPQPAAPPPARRPLAPRQSMSPPEIISESVMEAEIIEESPFGGSVEDHVSRHMDNREFDQRRSRLGKAASQQDAAADSRMHQVFDHSVSRLSSDAVSFVHDDVQDAYEKKGPSALIVSGGAIIDSLRDPHSLRQAILMAEILKRPEF